MAGSARAHACVADDAGADALGVRDVVRGAAPDVAVVALDAGRVTHRVVGPDASVVRHGGRDRAVARGGAELEGHPGLRGRDHAGDHRRVVAVAVRREGPAGGPELGADAGGPEVVRGGLRVGRVELVLPVGVLVVAAPDVRGLEEEVVAVHAGDLDVEPDGDGAGVGPGHGVDRRDQHVVSLGKRVAAGEGWRCGNRRTSRCRRSRRDHPAGQWVRWGRSARWRPVLPAFPAFPGFPKSRPGRSGPLDPEGRWGRSSPNSPRGPGRRR